MFLQSWISHFVFAQSKFTYFKSDPTLRNQDAKERKEYKGDKKSMKPPRGSHSDTELEYFFLKNLD